MYLKSLTLHNFKSYQQNSFEFSPQLNIIYGRNGAGKTNLLDAIYTLSMTRSNFLTTDQQLIRNDGEFFRLHGSLNKDDNLVSVVIKLQKGKKKVVERAGKSIARVVDHIGFMPVVMITPDDLNLINASNSERRKLADSTLSQVDHQYLENLVIYNRLLKQRNTQLKTWQESGAFDSVLLDTYDQRMHQPASAIYQARKSFFEQLLDRLQYYYNILCEGREPVYLVYESELAENSFTSLSKRNQKRDRISGRTNSGIHRDAITCTIDNRDARIYASQGQKKSLVFAIRLAQLEFMDSTLHYKPIMLLDDIFDKLDAYRVEHLLRIILSDTFGQVFITDTQCVRIESILAPYSIDIQKFEID